MLSPSDLVLRSQLGDQTVATTPDDDQPGFTPPPVAPFNALSAPNVWDAALVTQLAGVVGTEQVVRHPYPPDMWLITMPSTANASVAFTAAESPGTPPDFTLEPGGYARIPARGSALSMRNMAAVAVTPTVIGVAGFGGFRAGDFLVVPRG